MAVATAAVNAAVVAMAMAMVTATSAATTTKRGSAKVAKGRRGGEAARNTTTN